MNRKNTHDDGVAAECASVTLNESETVQSLLRAAAQALEPVSDTPMLDAKLLLSDAIERTPTWLATWPETVPESGQLVVFQAFIQRRLDNEPVAYILGAQEFWGLRFSVSPDVLIPRADTEIIIETVLQLPLPDTVRVLDMGTGSGAIAIAVASERPSWSVMALDVSKPALRVAQENAERLLGRGANEGVSFVHSHWYEAFNTESPTFDVIISNPPYIDANDQHLAQLTHEPRSALVAEQSGLADLQTIITNAPRYLAQGGFLLLEHGYDQHEAVQELLREAGFSSPRSVKDYGGNWRCMLAQYGTSQ